MGRTVEPSPDQPITRTIVSDFRLPAVKATDRVQVREIKILPSQPAGLHVHNGPVFGSIAAGSRLPDRGPADVDPAAGDVFYEPEGERIDVG